MGRASDREEKVKTLPPDDMQKRTIVDVIGWLTINGIAREQKKQKLLWQQNLRNVWNKAALGLLEQCPTRVASQTAAFLQNERNAEAIDELRVRVDFSVSNRPPG